MNIYKPCYNSFCEPAATERRSKKTHGLHRCTRSLWHGFFWPLSFDLYMDSKRICKRDRLRLLIKWRNNVRRPEGKPIIQFRVYCPKESKCHALARFVLFVRLVFEKTFAYIKLNTNIPNNTNIICMRISFFLTHTDLTNLTDLPMLRMAHGCPF